MTETTAASASALDAAERRLRRRPAKLAIDAALLAGFIAEFVTREGSPGPHSWIGVVLIPIVAVHLLSNLGWIRRVISRGRADREFSLAVLNAAFGFVTAICIITGFPIWLDWSDAGIWEGTHTVTGFISWILMFAHGWRNRGRLKNLLFPAKTG